MKKGDKIVLISLLFIILISFGGIYGYRTLNKEQRLVAVIKKEGKVIKKIDLNKVKNAEEIKIKYKQEEFNIVKVDKNRIRFVEGNCPDKICVKSGWLKKVGDSAACLPHKIIITIEGSNKLVDDVSY